jgi:hypothetical protein
MYSTDNYVVLDKLMDTYSIQLVKKCPHFLRNQKFHYCVHNRPPLIQILTQKNESHMLTTCLKRLVSILSSHLCLGLVKCHLSFRSSSSIRFSSSQAYYMARRSHISWFYHPDNT